MDPDLILGIDLGTTFCATAWVDEQGEAHVVPSAEGRLVTPSVLHFPDADTCIVGDHALRMVVADASNIVRFVKQTMGIEAHTLPIHGTGRSPQELSAIILRKLKRDAEAHLGCECRRAVITVPAYFNGAQRAATQEAGLLAGFEVLSIVNEPTAAAIAHSIATLGRTQRVMVFDLGGGTFDVTLMDVDGPTLRTRISDGNAELGGKDWDERLVELVAQRAADDLGADPRATPSGAQELYERCVAAKIQLSTRPRASIPVRAGDARTTVQVTREEFEEATAPLVAQCAATCRHVLERAGLGWEDVDDVLLVGGSTRMPMVRAMLEQQRGHPPLDTLDAETCVAAGAAYAAVLRHRPDHPAVSVLRARMAGRPAAIDAPIRVVDASTHTLGVVVFDAQGRECIKAIVPAATPLPCEHRARLAYAHDGMTSVRVEVTEGEGSVRDEVTIVGRVILDNLRPRPRGTPIDVTYRFGEDAMLEVSVTDVETGIEERAHVALAGALRDEDAREARTRLQRTRVR